MHHNVLRTIDGANPIDLACVDPPLAHAIHADGSFHFDVCSFEKRQLSPQATCVHMRMRMRAMHVRTHACMHVRTHACMHVRTHACVHRIMHAHTCEKKKRHDETKKAHATHVDGMGHPRRARARRRGGGSVLARCGAPSEPFPGRSGTRIKRVQESQGAEAAQPAHAVLRSTAGSPARRALSAQALPARLVSRHRTCANDNDK